MVKCLDQSVVPTKNRVKHVEYITAVYDFKKWLQSGLQISLSGHGSSSRWKGDHMDSCHLYRFIKRRNLPKFAEEACETEFTEPTHKDDIIILVKYRMASDGYAQPPQCFAPKPALRESRQDSVLFADGSPQCPQCQAGQGVFENGEGGHPASLGDEEGQRVPD